MSYISKYELEALGEPLGECVTTPKLGGGYVCGGGGGGGPTSTTVTQSNIPEWLSPQIQAMLGAATEEFFTTEPGEGDTRYITGIKPYQPYSQDPRDYVAPFTGLQRSAFGYAEGVGTPWEYTAAGSMIGNAGLGAYGMGNLGLDYGGAGYQSGLLGQDYGTKGGGLYGGMGAGYGAEAANLADVAKKYGGAGARFGGEAADLAEQEGGFYGRHGFALGDLAGALAPQAQYYSEAAAEAGGAGRKFAEEGGEQYGGMGAGYGEEAAKLSPEAQQYGRAAADIGGMGLRAEELGRDITGQARGYAGQAAGLGKLYERMATSPEDVNRFMSPYQKAVIERQKEGAIRDADVAAQTRKAAAARAGAFGGARQAIENAEANRALQSQLQGIEATGLQQAYQQAQANILNRAQLEAQGLSGAQQGLGTALQGGQLGLSGIGQAMAGQQAGLAGLSQAGQLYGLGMQGAGLGLQGVQQQLAGTAQDIAAQQAAMQGLGEANRAYQTALQGTGMGLQGLQQQLAGKQLGMQGAGMGLQGVGQAGQMYGLGMQGAGLGLQGVQQALAGTAQGMQGAGMGLQGVGQGLAGYGLMGQMGSQLGALGGQRLRSDMDIANLRYGYGQQQQAMEQQIINQAIQNYARGQERPYDLLSMYNALIRGYSTPGQTVTQYQAAPSGVSQLASLGTAGIGLSALGRMAGVGGKAGGVVDSETGIDRLALRKALAGD